MLRHRLPGIEPQNDESSFNAPPGIESQRESPFSAPPAVESQPNSPLNAPPGAEFVASEPRTAPQGISQSSFSQNYFKTFFVEEKELGRGGKGVVLLVTHLLDGFPLGQYACKRVPVGDDHAWLEKVLVEVQTLQKLSHANLVSYRHVWLEDYKPNKFGPTVPCAFILQQYCNIGDLHHYILGQQASSLPTARELKERRRRRSARHLEDPFDLHSPRRMPFDEIFSFFKDIAAGLHHLHSNGFIHRDIKPNNCLLHNDGQKISVLLSDFGEVQAVGAARNSTGATGTISYCAPEVLRRDGPGGAFGNFTVKSDIFSLGMIVYFMCFGKLPYSNADDINDETEDVDLLREEITAWAGFPNQDRSRSDLPDRLYRFLSRLLSLDPNERPSTEDILHMIRTGHDVEESDAFHNHKPLGERRISSVDSPSPHPNRRGLVKPTTKETKSNLSSTTFVAPALEPSRSHSPQKSPLLRQRAASRTIEWSKDLAAGSTQQEQDSTIRTDIAYNRPLVASPRLALPPPDTSSPNLLKFYVIKLAVFLTKYLSISTPCMPMSSNWLVTYHLLLIASFDLLLPVTPMAMSRFSVLSLLLHVAVVIACQKLGVMCETFQALHFHEA
jgi:serine/threonine protein kinase